MVDHLESRGVKARKIHVCGLCGYPIPKGYKYRLSTAVDAGEFYHWKTHECCEAMTTGWDEIDWECTEPYTFTEEHIGELGQEWMNFQVAANEQKAKEATNG
jgi:hypothetical protein